MFFMIVKIVSRSTPISSSMRWTGTQVSGTDVRRFYWKRPPAAIVFWQFRRSPNFSTQRPGRICSTLPTQGLSCTIGSTCFRSYLPATLLSSKQLTGLRNTTCRSGMRCSGLLPDRAGVPRLSAKICKTVAAWAASSSSILLLPIRKSVLRPCSVPKSTNSAPPRELISRATVRSPASGWPCLRSRA